MRCIGLYMLYCLVLCGVGVVLIIVNDKVGQCTAQHTIGFSLAVVVCVLFGVWLRPRHSQLNLKGKQITVDWSKSFLDNICTQFQL